jgi:hypothetical protein
MLMNARRGKAKEKVPREEAMKAPKEEKDMEDMKESRGMARKEAGKEVTGEATSLGKEEERAKAKAKAKVS